VTGSCSMPNPGSVPTARGSPWRGSPTSAAISAAPSRVWSSRSAERRQRGDAAITGIAAAGSFEIDRLEAPGFVERRAPDLVRSLVIGAGKGERYPEAEVEIARALQRIDQLFGIELRAGALECVDQDVRRHETFQGRVVGRLAGKILRERVLVFEHRARMAGDRRHDLCHEDTGRVARPQ